MTLAICKPQIRRTAQKGDLILGTGSVENVGNDRLIYAAIVDDAVSWQEYGANVHYEFKQPGQGGVLWSQYGDNIYFKHDGRWLQRENASHDEANQDKDLGGRNVLVCECFWYFGREAIRIPKKLSFIIKKSQGHRCFDDERTCEHVMTWLAGYKTGRHGLPFDIESHRRKVTRRRAC